MNKEIVEKILEETEQGYDLIADKFSQTRKYFWRDLEFIKNYAKNDDKILDYGCGNGRLLELIGDKNIEYRGVDISQKLIDTASQKYENNRRKFQKISGFDTLPFPDNYFNIVYSIAVFQHIPSGKLRLKIAKELYRVLMPDGIIIVTVWNLWQMKYLKNVFKNYINKLIYRSKLDWNDCYVSFKDNEGKIFQRYHHTFTKNEFKKLFLAAGFKALKCDIIKKRNIVLIARKYA